MRNVSTYVSTMALMLMFGAAFPGSIPAAIPDGSGPVVAGIAPTQDEIDAFMEKVLERREINWSELYNYTFSEMEKLRIRGVEIAALQSFDQEYTWYVRDGYLVRSPWKVNGVEVDEQKREEAELDWISNVEDDKSEAQIERDSFFDFEFEPGNYLFAGREVFEGREVLKIEYYPTNIFGDEEDETEGRRKRDDEDEDFDEEEFEHMFDKTSLVTMLVIPEEHQVVKWTFENVGFEFLPYRWLVRMDELRASMVMHQPIEDIWLPREISAAASASTASFELNVEYTRDFSDYKETAVGAGVVFGRPKR